MGRPETRDVGTGDQHVTTEAPRDEPWEDWWPRPASENWEHWWPWSASENWDGWWRTDRLDSLGWAALFLWGALVVVANYTDFSSDYEWWDGWGVFFVGAGAIVLAKAAFRMFAPRYRSKWGWDLFWGSAFLALGLGGVAHAAWYALPLVAIAIFFLKEAFARQP